MNFWDIAIVVLIAAAAAAAVTAIVRGKVKCGGCGGDCSLCAKTCAKRK